MTNDKLTEPEPDQTPPEKEVSSTPGVGDSSNSAPTRKEPEADPAQVPSESEPKSSTPSPDLKEASTSSQGESQPIDPHEKQRLNRPENQDFVRVLNMFGGAIPPTYIDHVAVGHDMHIHMNQHTSLDVTPPPNRDSAEVPQWEIHKIQHVYQRHAAYSSALKALSENRCVVLRGKPQVGKRAAAIHLGLELRREATPIWELSAEDELTNQIKTTIIRPSTIYLIDGLLRDKGRALKSIAARAMLETLRQCDCYLIVCANLDVPFPPDLKVITLEPLPIPVATVVEVHLAYYNSDRSFTAEQAQAALIHPQIEEVLKKGLPPVQADRLANLIAEALREATPLEDAVRGLAAAAEKDVRQWFDETADDIATSSFRIALATFNGARYIAVDEAARALTQILQPQPETPDKEKVSVPTSPFKKPTKDKKLKSARAKLFMHPFVTDYSDHALIEVVELEDSGYSAALLKYLWAEFDELRQPLLDWLCKYALEGPLDIRLRAAGAIGFLATLEFDYLRARVFRMWAQADTDDSNIRRKYYQALGNALGVLIWNDASVEDVLGLLQAWVNDSNKALKWAAARAYAQVGLRYPREAINQWRCILESEARVKIRLTESFGIVIPHPLHMSVVDAIISLFLRAVELPYRLQPVYEQALEGLAAWVETDAKERTSEQAGLPLFLVLTAIRFPLGDGTGDSDEWPPAMLYIVGTQPDSSYRRLLAGLWRRALNHHELGQVAINALKQWTKCANENDWLEKTLTALLKDLLALPDFSERERGRLSMHLTRWYNLPKSPLNVAGRLLVALDLC